MNQETNGYPETDMEYESIGEFPAWIEPEPFVDFSRRTAMPDGLDLAAD